MRILVMCFLALFASGAVAAAQDDGLRFSDFPVSERYNKPSKAPVLATKEQRAFRTRLRQAAKEKPNFAGHYIVTIWGCGTECISGAIIDARTGSVIMLPFSLCCWGVDVPDDFEPLAYRIDSSLIVVSGARDENTQDNGKHYYTVRNKRLVELHKTR